MKRRALFVGEAVTLAHVSRPVVLAGALDPARYDVHLAYGREYEALFQSLPYGYSPIQSIPAEKFRKRLAKGDPVYEAAELRGYVEDDLRLLDAIKPDVVIGDFRLSLGISARLAKVPYVTITNAYWGPFTDPRFVVPELPFVKVLGAGLGQLLFDAVRPVAFGLHTRPLNKVRREHGLPDLGYDLRVTYTDAEAVFYADCPELIPARDLPASHRYIGPVVWQPDSALPAWWSEIPDDRPVIYVTLGSSVEGTGLIEVVDALASLPVTLIVAWASADKPALGPTVFGEKYLPGEEACKRADLVICNGGSPTTAQALSAGVPFIGVASNLDQFLNMHYMEQAGIGLTVRPGRGMKAALKAAAGRALADAGLRQRVEAARQAAQRHKPEQLFPEYLAKVV
jgi:UDP:flavonoid glycosyltransferase YjiC (YdhE family)